MVLGKPLYLLKHGRAIGRFSCILPSTEALSADQIFKYTAEALAVSIEAIMARTRLLNIDMVPKKSKWMKEMKASSNHYNS